MNRSIYKKAVAEVVAKTEEQIERETAEKWAACAVACYRQASKAVKKASGMNRASGEWLLRAEDYRHEALEHGSLAEDLTFFKKMKKEIDQERRVFS